MPIAHFPQECFFEPAVMKQDRVIGVRQNIDEFVPDTLLVGRRVSPEDMMDCPDRFFHSDTDKIIEVAIRKPLNVEEYWRAFHGQFRVPDYMGFVFADRKGFQGVVVFFRSRGQAL